VGDPIRLETNKDWVNKQTRPACKYAPVGVLKSQGTAAIESMQEALRKRIKTCQALGLVRGNQVDECGWFSFMRVGPSHEPHLRPSSVPVIVISGGSANKIAADLKKDYSLAWHPMNVRSEPIYLLVHRLDFNTYAASLADVMGRFRNMHLIGWDGGAMTGFGAARAAALAFADTLPYRPNRILMMDQDVVKTEGTRFDKPGMQAKVTSAHEITKKPIIGYGVGYPTREPVPKFLEETAKPKQEDFNSPAQQFVSIRAPFRKQRDDGIYPPYMVAGGEDMLMGLQQKLDDGNRNVALLGEKILKKELKGEVDKPNAYWSKARVETLAQLFEAEKDTQVEFDGKLTTLDGLMGQFVANKWLDSHPSADSYNVSACVIERIILRLHKEGKFPPEEKGTVFNRWQNPSK